MTITFKCVKADLSRSLDSAGKPVVAETVQFQIVTAPGVSGGNFSLNLNGDANVGQYTPGSLYTVSTSPAGVPAAAPALQVVAGGTVPAAK